MSVVIHDNFLDEKYFNELNDEIFGAKAQADKFRQKVQFFPWLMSMVTDGSGEYQMVHMAYEHGNACSQFYNKLIPFLTKLDVYSLQRVKVNLLKREEKIIEHGMHIDVEKAPDNALSSILYMNTNNGYTKFETGEKVESVENRLVTFPNSLKHTGTTNNCKAPYRCVINVDWIKKVNRLEI